MPYRYRNKDTGAVQALRTAHRGLARASNWELLSDEDKTSEDTATEDTSAEDTEDSAPRRSRRSRSSSAQTEQSGDAQA